jgi:hypothetical protein
MGAFPDRVGLWLRRVERVFGPGGSSLCLQHGGLAQSMPMWVRVVPHWLRRIGCFFR